MNKSLIGMTALAVTLLPVVAISLPAEAAYETNKFDFKKEVENGGWTVAWSEDISETDALRGVVAAGVSVYTANPGAFYLWCDSLVEKTIASLSQNAKSKFPRELTNTMNRLTADVVMSAIKGKSPKQVFRQFDTVDFKAGAIKYSGRNYVNTPWGKKTISRTWGMKPYVAFRIRSSN